jgi:glucose/arabinose dehydrogenase
MNFRPRLRRLLQCPIAVAATSAVLVAQELVANRAGVRHEPAIVPATAQRIASLRLSAGFRLGVFAADLGAPRMLAVGRDGTVFVTRPQSGDVLALGDGDGDGRADRRAVVVRQLPGVHGIAIRDNRMYLATVDAIYEAALDGAAVSVRSRLLDGLPPGERHPNRTLGLSPDGRLFVSVGSTCNLCDEPHRLSATIAEVPLDGGTPTVFATGLRNTLGFAWHPLTGEMWGMDNGADWLGHQAPPEELNRLRAGGSYGWPLLYGHNEPVRLSEYPLSIELEHARRTAIPASAGYTAHAAPMQMVFYDGAMFPIEYRSDAFVAMRGSWNRRPPTGYEVVRIWFDGGQPQEFSSFVTGFLSADGSRTFARPVGVAIGADGALLFGDEANGLIYRVSHTGSSPAETPGRVATRQASGRTAPPLR